MDKIAVTPLAGVWIEIKYEFQRIAKSIVTPLAGVWIEIFLRRTRSNRASNVTPLVGVRIEISGSSPSELWAYTDPKNGGNIMKLLTTLFLLPFYALYYCMIGIFKLSVNLFRFIGRWLLVNEVDGFMKDRQLSER